MRFGLKHTLREVVAVLKKRTEKFEITPLRRVMFALVATQKKLR